jgi:hypothetical protein
MFTADAALEKQQTVKNVIGVCTCQVCFVAGLHPAALASSLSLPLTPCLVCLPMCDILLCDTECGHSCDGGAAAVARRRRVSDSG